MKTELDDAGEMLVTMFIQAASPLQTGEDQRRDVALLIHEVKRDALEAAAKICETIHRADSSRLQDVHGDWDIMLAAKSIRELKP